VVKQKKRLEEKKQLKRGVRGRLRGATGGKTRRTTLAKSWDVGSVKTLKQSGRRRKRLGRKQSKPRLESGVSGVEEGSGESGKREVTAKGGNGCRIVIWGGFGLMAE